MLPSILAGQLQEGLADYIETTFPMTNPTFEGSLKNMLATKDSVFHEPYVAVRLPFRLADEMPDMFDSIHPKHEPYVHQQKAFERLTGEDGRSSLIATGTGSGKTECFLYPILEYCYHHRGESGIKALIIYPMNALASDQAKRIANLIYNSPELRGNVTAGMYVGGHEDSPTRVMTEDKVITDHETLLSSPPDILLTNYKMLDFLLVRPKDNALWEENNPETLKYITVDELHTFDGAQGTDLACLLRRLKARLFTPQGYLCCVGTSATMGAKDSADSIRDYAATVFGETFEDDAVITEDRLSATEFFDGHEVTNFSIPNNEQLQRMLECKENDDQEGFLKVAIQGWLDDSFDESNVVSDNQLLEIASQLMSHSFTQTLLEYMGGNYVQASYVCEELSQKYPQLKELTDMPEALNALFALISHARSGVEGKLRPFLTVQVQLWMRELRRLVAKVSEEDVVYALATDLNDNQAKQYLPVINCRDCGETGWASIINERGNLTLTDLNAFYNLYFKQDQKVQIIYPHKHSHIPKKMMKAQVCPNCLQLHVGDEANEYCSSCGTETFAAILPTELDTSGSKSHKQYCCPFCGSNRGLSIIGLRSVTAISAGMSQLFSSKFNDDKKLLAFSDNVQDAAYRAGFFNSRTWKFGIRSAIQHFALTEEPRLTLDEFSEKFIGYWHKNLSDEEFVSRFIAPNMTWMRAYERMKRTGNLGSEKDARMLVSDIENRLKYEIMLEYGLSSRIGRTLEKSGCSVLGFIPETISSIADVVRERSINETGALNETPIETFEKMVMGFLYILRSSGAFVDPAFNVYSQSGGKSYMLSNSNIKWLPGLKTGRNTPRFICELSSGGKRISAFDDLARSSRYADWVESCADEMLIREDVPIIVTKIILNELAKSKVLAPMPTENGNSIWGIDKREVFISTSVKQFVCETCGNAISVAEENSHVWEAAPCTRASCGGHVHLNEDASIGYYGKLYSQGDIVRVVAREHTGLLDRDKREELERNFKQDAANQMPWDTNVLSCTPTLEMGIDIGDLSTVVLCSIPPGQAQFLQRAGRAGRKDGNALTVAVANAKPHDLYYYSEPMEMISGVVEPPKIFLRASAVLERQFIAYCMDCWVKRGVSEKAIPKHVGVCLSKINEKLNDLFPFNFLQFVQNNLTSLLRTFIQMFAQYLDENSIADLRTFAQGSNLKESPMHMKVYEAFESLKKQKDALNKSIKQLNTLIKEIEKKTKDSSNDEELKELKSERIALMNVVQSINKKDVFNFLSEEGLLPNYAFPEAGIILKAVLYRKEDAEVEKSKVEHKVKYEKMVYEYSRSASSAISEFAPTNNFYVDGRKLSIDQVDLTTAQATKWRLCPNCSHAQIEETGKNTSSCPQCGSPAWADAGQLRSMLKVQMVYSNMDYTKSLINDDSEDRSSTFYFKQLLVDVDEEHDISKAYRMDNEIFPFGYEFLKKAILREINFGESDVVGDKLTVSGTEGIRKGFKICKHCGKIQPESGVPVHTYTCRAKNSQTENTEPFEECLFLYREFSTEALRLLIPATTMDGSKVRQESFAAAFMLGMKKYFGNVDHLRACVSEVPVVDAEYRKQYLVIYDSVPGGTGYLKQLMQYDGALIEIFEAALSVLENCECKDDAQKDGCYHCLYAYRQSQNIGQISRSTAIRILKQILRGRKNIEKIEKLGNIPVNSLFESELERRFIEALSQMGNDSRKISITKALVNNKEGYLLQLGDSMWEIEPQVVLDAAHGVPVQSRADFVIWPVKVTPRKRPVAIYTDGFLYHKDKAADDTLKREAVRRSNKFRVWSLSWKDVQNVFQIQGDYATRTLSPEKMPSGSTMYKRIVERGSAQGIQPDKMSTLELLMRYLELPDSEKIFSAQAQAYSLSLLNAKDIGNELAFADWNQSVSPAVEAFGLYDYQFILNDVVFGKWIPNQNNSHLSVCSGITKSDIRSPDAQALVCSILDDIKSDRSEKYEAEWNGFWHFYNVMQFLDKFVAVSANGLEQQVYSSLPITDSELLQTISEKKINDAIWQDIAEQLFDIDAENFLHKLMDMGARAPSSVGYELIGTNGAVIAECEFAWEDLRIAFLMPTQLDYMDAFEDSGWKIILFGNDLPKEIFDGGAK